jgi:hypothetical protein
MGAGKVTEEKTIGISIYLGRQNPLETHLSK